MGMRPRTMPPMIDDRTSRRSESIGIALLVLATVIAYFPALQAGFVWDDDDYLLNNPVIPTARGLLALWVPGVTPQYYPAVFTSFWIEHQLWGFAPFGYHAVNVLLHAANAALIVQLARRLLLPWPWVIGAVFALHPVHVESVAWITERKNVLSGIGYLLAMRSYLLADAAVRTGARASRLRVATLGWFLFALLSKSVTCSLPAVLVLVHLYRRDRIDRARITALLPLFAVGLALGLHTAHVEKTHVGAVGADFGLDLLERSLIAAHAICFYLQKLVAPWPLVFIYPRWQIDPGDPVRYVPVALVFAAGTAAGIAWRRGHRGPLVAGAFFVGTLSPALGFVDVYPMLYSFVADHFQYLASLGAITLVVAAVRRAATIVPQVRFLGVVLLLVLGATTWHRCLAYRDVETLWRDTVGKNPAAWMAQNNLACLEMDRGDHASALVRLEDALQHTFSTVEQQRLRRNIGRAYAGLRRHTDELATYQALQAEFGHHESYVARALENLGRDAEAYRWYAQAVDDLQQRNARILFARHLLRRRQVAAAIPLLERHLALEAGVGRVDTDAQQLLALARRQVDGRSTAPDTSGR